MKTQARATRKYGARFSVARRLSRFTRAGAVRRCWCRALARHSPDATIRPDTAPEVFVEERDSDSFERTVFVPPYSVNLYSFSLVK
jgi:hypothetical protein